MKLHVETQREYAFSADKVWSITGDFGGLKNWLPGILAIRVEGNGAADAGGNAVRVIDVFDGSVTTESLESFSDEKRSYSYRIVSAKGLDASAEYLAHFTVTPLDASHCRVDWLASFRVPAEFPPEKSERARQKIQQMYSMCLQNLEGVLAQGR
jgi:hypothetical protein